MVKHFCDVCGKELTDADEVRFSLDMYGKELCRKHIAKMEKFRVKRNSYTLKANGRTYAVDNNSIFPLD